MMSVTGSTELTYEVTGSVAYYFVTQPDRGKRNPGYHIKH